MVPLSSSESGGEPHPSSDALIPLRREVKRLPLCKVAQGRELPLTVQSAPPWRVSNSPLTGWPLLGCPLLHLNAQQAQQAC